MNIAKRQFQLAYRMARRAARPGDNRLVAVCNSAGMLAKETDHHYYQHNQSAVLSGMLDALIAAEKVMASRAEDDAIRAVFG
ncbi:hypothetical protein [Ferrimonas balearica]|uniref:hypothetical protein n=1 Tax=Ferrimonas balearica TaxID=44012 RepID=UPI001C995904|nr:hypothetical protein [Ferrimonas balearica]MBY5920405.1 hypothetical protein [Ferrimonas balearica]MBY5996910.1 hypothetical protein [Ferrimonas balearica]